MKSVNIAIISIVVVVSIAAIAIGYEVSSNETTLLSSLTGQPDSDTPEPTKTSTDKKGTTGTGEKTGANTGTGTGTSKRASGSGTSSTGTGSGTSSTGTGYAYKISSESAQKIANTNIEQPGFYAGTPRAYKGNYIVPILDPSSNERGYFLINGTSGEVIEGAGGVL